MDGGDAQGPVELKAMRRGAPLTVPERTLPQVLFETAARYGNHPAFSAPGDAGLTWADAAERVRALANGLLSLGIRKGDRVAIVAETSPEWLLADYAILAVGGVTVTVFPTLTPAQVAFLLKDSGSRLAFCGAAEASKVEAASREAPALEGWVCLAGAPAGSGRSLNEVEAAGRAFAATHPQGLDARLTGIQPDDLASLIYTSGTTGSPKGARLTHRNFVASVAASIEALQLPMHPRAVAFLPLAHVYQRQNAFLLTALAGSAVCCTPASLAKELPRIQPTLMASVPRLYERIHEQILRRVDAMPGRRQRIFRWASGVAQEHSRVRSTGASAAAGLRLKHRLCDVLVYRKLRQGIGASHLLLAVTGSAAMRPDLLHFFHGIGVRILEGYGLTETAAPTNVNPLETPRVGTVGPPLPGVEQAIASDGEILVRGPMIFDGYHGRPEESAAAFVELEGKRWFRTGDLGEFDDQGYLRVVDRKKELEVLDTGKKLAPVPIEEALKASPLIAEAVVIATGRKFAACLLQPDYVALLRWMDARGTPVDPSTMVRGADPTGVETILSVPASLLGDPAVRARYQEEIDRVNAGLAPFERLAAFRLVPDAFTVEGGELTPTLKKRRRRILERRGPLVEEMFASAERGALRTARPEARS